MFNRNTNKEGRQAYTTPETVRGVVTKCWVIEVYCLGTLGDIILGSIVDETGGEISLVCGQVHFEELLT